MSLNHIWKIKSNPVGLLAAPLVPIPIGFLEAFLDVSSSELLFKIMALAYDESQASPLDTIPDLLLYRSSDSRIYHLFDLCFTVLMGCK